MTYISMSKSKKKLLATILVLSKIKKKLIETSETEFL